MKIYGYIDEGLPPDEVVPELLAEITLVASPEELRKISAFLSAAAEKMERMGRSYNHEHLADRMPGFDESPHFVVYNPEFGG